MAEVNLIDTYFPEISEIPFEKLQEVRNRLDTHIRRFNEELDTRPNTPFGDWMLSPAAEYVASLEIALGRFMSDLDLENVAKGIIYNCPFVEKYLNNFAIISRDSLNSSGVIRLVFCEDRDYVLDRGVRFSFAEEISLENETVVNVFSIRHYASGPLKLKRVGTVGEDGENYVTLTEIAPGKYAVDLPVTGTMSEEDPILNGDVGFSDRVLQDCESITAIGDFLLGIPEESLPSLAKKARENIYTTTFTSRGGARKSLLKEFPDLLSVSSVITGDAEMTRDKANPLGLGGSSMDLYARSPGYKFAESQTFRIDYDSSAENFVAQLDLIGIPFLIKDISAVGQETLDLSSVTTLYSKSSDSNKAPILSAAYSAYEDLYIEIDMPKDGTNSNLLTLRVDPETGIRYVIFKIDYLSDPLLRPISALANDRNEMPVGVDVMVRGFIPYHIKSLVVNYTRQTGTTMLLDQARNEIYNYIIGLGYPRTWSNSKIIDAMFYAGAEDVKDILVEAEVKFTVADYVLPESAPLPTTNLAGAKAEAITPYQITTATTSGLIPSFIDINSGTASQDWSAVGPRNISYIIDKENITFSEAGL